MYQDTNLHPCNSTLKEILHKSNENNGVFWTQKQKKKLEQRKI